MPIDCPYCGEPVPEDEYEAHLRGAHYEELSAIDRRRVGVPPSGPKRRNLALYVAGGAVLVVFAMGYVTVFFASGGASSAAVQPDEPDGFHEHGTMEISYDDTVVAFDDPALVGRDECFHFHAYDDGEIWHAHCENVTIEYALETLGMEVTEGTFVVDDESFSEANGDTVSVTVDGEAVDPQEYVLEGVGSTEDALAGAGDHVEVVAESGS